MEDRQTALEIVAAAQETKAESILLYDLQHQSPITDFVLICSGRSQAHVRGICDRIEERLKKGGAYPRSIEGHQEGSWVLMDYGVVIVHIFHPDTRRYYDLENLLTAHPCEPFGPVAAEGGAADDSAAPA